MDHDRFEAFIYGAILGMGIGFLIALLWSCLYPSPEFHDREKMVVEYGGDFYRMVLIEQKGKEKP